MVTTEKCVCVCVCVKVKETKDAVIGINVIK